MNVRRKGHTYELKIVKELAALGFDNLTTTRNGSRFMDGQGVDIISQPIAINKLFFHPQCKSVSTKIDYLKLNKDFKLNDYPLVIFHKFTSKKEKNFCSEGEFVILPKEFFYSLISKIQQNGI